MADVDAQNRAVRRKFKTPPVKLACLSCRTSRTRCDGGRPCQSCANKGNECLYKPSRRGGPRIRKKPAATFTSNSTSSPDTATDSHTTDTTTTSLTSLGFDAATAAAFAAADQLLPDVSQQPVDVQNYIDPGAALGQLPEMPPDSDFIFDSLFHVPFSDADFTDFNSLPDSLLSSPQSGPLVRIYRSDDTLLQAYYCWIHPYFPIFPAPEWPGPAVDTPSVLSQSRPPYESSEFEPTTPVSLALSAVLALIPSGEDTDPMSTESILFRRKCAQFFAQAAIEAIEAESEIPESATEPSKALESSPPPADRNPFHPRVPVELECIVALDILSMYEYAQRGNIKKMRTRAGQALMDAMMTFSLHTQTDDDDFFAEAKRRIWWMTYVCATQSSIVSNTPPPLELYTVDFTAKLPLLEADPEAWAVFVESQKTILTATRFVMELNKAMATQADMGPIYRKMAELETQIAPLVERADTWTFSSNMSPAVDQSELVLIRSLRSMARIKLNSARIKVHRYCAFYDFPVFEGRHCDLKSTSTHDDGPIDGLEALPWPSCSCSSPKDSPASCHSHHSHDSHSHDSHSNHDSNHSNHGTGHQDSGFLPGSSTFSSPTTAAAMAHGAHGGLNNLQAQQQAQAFANDVARGMGAPAPADQMLLFSAAPKVPYTSRHSAKVCLRSALSIAQGFDNLPYPNPTGQYGVDMSFLAPTSPIVAPRMLPSFICCAMQGAYVFLSIYRKTKGLRSGDGSSITTGGITSLSSLSSLSSLAGANGNNAYLLSMLLQLQRGLTSILAALENYATAFEALRSMRDQIRYSSENLIALEG